MARKLVPTAILGLIAGLITAPPGGAVIPEGFSDVVVLGTESVRIDQDVVVTSGDVVANQADPDPSPPPPGLYELFFDKRATAAGSLRADSVFIGKNATVGGDVEFNELDNEGSIAGSELTPLALPVFDELPSFLTGPADGPDVSVGKNGSETLAPGDYGDIVLDQGATLHLTGGAYNVASIETVNKQARITFGAPSEVRIAGTLKTAKEVFLGPADGSGVAASEIVIFVAGEDEEVPPGASGKKGKPGGSGEGGEEGDGGGDDEADGPADATKPEAVRIDMDSTVAANLYAPNGSIRIEQRTAATGAFLARNVRIDRASEIALDTFFANSPPVAGDDSATVAEGGTVATLDSGETSLLANDTDPDGDDLSVSPTPVSSPAHGAVVLNPDGTFTYTHDGSETTADGFEYEVCDDGLAPGPLCDVGVVAITVIPVNDPPDAQDDLATTDEDVPVTIDVLANDSDVDGNLVPSSVKVTVLPDRGGRAEADPSTGAVTYTPSSGFSGTESFAYQVCDDGTPLPAECASATVTVTVNPVNEAPVAIPDDVLSDAATVEITLAGADEDGDALTFSIVSGPSAGSLSPITPLTATTASVTYTADTPGDSDAFTFQVDDGNGGTGQAEIRINPPPESPEEPPPPLEEVVASDASVETFEDTAVDVRLSGAAPDGVALSFSIVSGPASGSVGAVTSTGDTTATVRYTPDAGFTGGDSFDFQACGDVDGSGDTGQAGECDTATVNVSVVVAESFPPPAAPDLSISTPKDTPVTLDLGSGGTTGDEPAVEDRRATARASRSGGTVAQRAEAGNNGARPGDAPRLGLKAETAITVGAGWSATTDVPPAFFWSGSAPVDASDGPFTFTLAEPGCVSVTDDFLPGDRFRLSDNGEVIGSTPRVAFGDPQTDDVEQGPDAAFADPTYSSATFGLDAGTHSISIEIIESPASGGRGYIRVDEAGSPLCDGGNVYTIETLPSNGILLDAAGDQITAGQTLDDLSVSYVPDAGFVGTDSFTYSITDQLLQKTTATVSVSVTDPGVVDCDDCVTLTIQKLGAGSGTVTSNPQAVNCGAVCSVEVAPGSFLVLLARPDDAVSEFAGWGGDCSGTDPIFGVTVDESKTCTATFDSVP
ncbi:MAG: Ig-like domain-containing protein [bacterium]